ncbi:general secretion pathway protein K [Methylobacterium sp. BE186]|uniref:general secretion pathway protein GspK n=1 Tax=Methylobacterium sp. BE186 TaxID=2817715 RepID=UPI002861D745|nr:type II secretion system protein GspK [Methylobacterium sp. BE186]MDR7038610.1 general secretion pathway protein K [Methylobacterium sp. BE186]
MRRPLAATGPDTRETSQAGFVLPTVLAVLIVVSGLAAAITLRTRATIALTAAARDRIVLDAETDGIVNLVGLWLAQEARGRAPASGLPLDGRAVRCTLDAGRTVTVAVQDQGGLIDLNASPRPVLEEALRRLGIGAGDALAVAAQIVDFRDPDDIPEPNGGAESRRYREERLGYGPRNAPFASPDEIDQLPAMTPATYARLRPALTVHGGTAGFDAARMEWRLAPLLPADALGPVAASRPSDGIRFEVTAMVEAGRGARSIRAGIVALDDPARPAGALLSWRRPTEWSAGEPLAGHAACGPIVAVFGAAG